MASLFSLLQHNSSAVHQIAASTRWYPTPEQLAILRALYMGGVQTLSGSQIRQITAYLSFYGKIEPKNVFYWFQNRKARDRKKLKRLNFSLEQKTPLATFTSPSFEVKGEMEATSVSAEDVICEQKLSLNCTNEQAGWIRIMNLEPNARAVQTLELFPTRSGDASAS